MDKNQSQSPDNEKVEEVKDSKSKKGISKKLAGEGYHNCTRYYLERDNKSNISGLGKVKNKIKAMHESSIDEYNAQQHNTGLFIKKDGKKYELVDVKVQGRKNPLKMFMEK